jgi:hypothetical protein
MAANIIKRLERYYIGVVEDKTASKKEKADAARQLLQLKLLNAQRTAKQLPMSNVLGSIPGE